MPKIEFVKWLSLDWLLLYQCCCHFELLRPQVLQPSRQFLLGRFSAKQSPKRCWEDVFSLKPEASLLPFSDLMTSALKPFCFIVHVYSRLSSCSDGFKLASKAPLWHSPFIEPCWLEYKLPLTGLKWLRSSSLLWRATLYHGGKTFYLFYCSLWR